MKYVLMLVVLAVGGLVAATYSGDEAQSDAPPKDAVAPGAGAGQGASGAAPEQPAGEPSGGAAQQEIPAAAPRKDAEYASRFKEKQDLLKDRVADCITWLVTGKRTAEQRTDLERTLILAMEEERLGDPFSRSETARRTVDMLLRQLECNMPKKGLQLVEVSPQQKMFIDQMADQVALDMRRKEPAAGTQQHTGTLMGSIDYDAPKGYTKISWATIGGFEYVDHMKLPKAVTALSGKKVAVAGYMITLGEVEDIREFLLVESGWSCCFGTPPDVNQVIEVRLPKDMPGLEYTTTPIAVTGVMDVGEEVEDGFVISVYRIAAEKVVDVE